MELNGLVCSLPPEGSYLHCTEHGFSHSCEEPGYFDRRLLYRRVQALVEQALKKLDLSGRETYARFHTWLNLRTDEDVKSLTGLDRNHVMGTLARHVRLIDGQKDTIAFFDWFLRQRRANNGSPPRAFACLQKLTEQIERHEAKMDPRTRLGRQQPGLGCMAQLQSSQSLL